MHTRNHKAPLFTDPPEINSRKVIAIAPRANREVHPSPSSRLTADNILRSEFLSGLLEHQTVVEEKSLALTSS
jgi:hypothetical protein